MKKILLLFVALTFALQVNAATWNASSRVQTVGNQLLTKNGITTKMTFKVLDGAIDNSEAVSTKVLNISTTDLSYAGNDNEVAAVVSKELGHIICCHYDKAKINSLAIAVLSEKLGNNNIASKTANSEFTSSIISAKEQEEADIVGATLMINAGYNPLAMVVWITKQPGSTMDILKSRPSNADRAMNTFDFLSYQYPSKVKAGYNCNEYKNFLTYANPIIQKRESSKRKLAKFQKEQKKLQATRDKNLNRYKANGGLNSWGVTYDLLMNSNEDKK